MREEIKKYELNNNLTIDKLKENGFRAGGFMKEILEPKFHLYEFLIEDIELHLEIGITPNKKFIFDDFDGVVVIDDCFCQPYTPFYNENQDFRFLNKVIKEYNKTMDSLVDKEILKEKELKKTKKLELIKEVK